MLDSKENIKDNVHLLPATLADYPTIQNMARFYVYDMSRECGFISADWAIPTDGLYESFNFKNYFGDPTRKAFLVKVGEELAGFVLLNQIGTEPKTNWNMGEFFILAKFQHKGIGKQVAHEIWDMHPGNWEVSVLPENKSALSFWRRTIGAYTDGHYMCATKQITFDGQQPQRTIFAFDTYSRVFIREAKEEDQPAIVDLSIKVWKQAYQGIIDNDFLNALCFEKRLRGRVEKATEPGHYSIVACCKQKIVGFCDFGVSRHPAYGKGEIRAIYMLPEYQQQGIGEKLIRQAMHRLEQEHLTPVIVLTLAQNFPAHNFYQKLGFRLQGTTTTQVGPSTYLENVYVYRKTITVHSTELVDISSFVALSYQKRRAYEQVQPQFWRYAGPQAEVSQTRWFESLLRDKDHIMLTAKRKEKVVGFMIGKLIKAPEVYNPGGLTLMIDDFCVESDLSWTLIGEELLKEIKELARRKGAVQLLVVCGAHDKQKGAFLTQRGLRVASNWYVGDIA